jgi:hypothetical protein
MGDNMGMYQRDFKPYWSISKDADEQLRQLLLSSDNVLTEEQKKLAIFYISEKYGTFYLDLIFEKFPERQLEFLPSLLRVAGETCDYRFVKYLIGKVKDINMFLVPAHDHSVKETLLDVVARERNDSKNTISLVEGYTYIIDLLRKHGAKYAKELL